MKINALDYYAKKYQSVSLSTPHHFIIDWNIHDSVTIEVVKEWVSEVDQHIWAEDTQLSLTLEQPKERVINGGDHFVPRKLWAISGLRFSDQTVRGST
jgi:hypothetical protein